MSHRSSAAAATAVKHALKTAINTALADETEIDISFGLRWPAQFDDAVAVASVESHPDDPNVGSTLRSRYDTLSIGVSVVSFRPGWDTTAEVAASDRAYELLALIDQHLRTGDNITLGGAALWCLLADHQSDGATIPADDQMPEGRLIEIAATFTARVHIRN